jgi:hypothetical protein
VVLALHHPLAAALCERTNDAFYYHRVSILLEFSKGWNLNRLAMEDYY